MSASLLKDAPFEQHSVTVNIPGSGWETDEHGNNVPKPGTVKTLTVLIAIDRDRKRQLQLQEGANTQLSPLALELIDPLRLPAGVSLGSTVELSWNRTPHTGTITGITPNDLVGINLGEVIHIDALPKGGA